MAKFSPLNMAAKLHDGAVFNVHVDIEDGTTGFALYWVNAEGLHSTEFEPKLYKNAQHERELDVQLTRAIPPGALWQMYVADEEANKEQRA